MRDITNITSGISFNFTDKVMLRKQTYGFSIPFLLLVLSVFITPGCTYDRAEVVPEHDHASISYKEDIQPIMAANCYSCHTAASTDPDKAGYAFLDDYEELKRYALRPSTSNSSLTKLQARIRFVEFPGMPLKQPPLAETDIRKIEAWIKAGAPNN